MRDFSWADADRRLLDTFLDQDVPAQRRYELLFRYFVSGFLYFRTPSGSGAKYPGARSNNGPVTDAMEGFTRIAPFIASWLSKGRASTIRTIWEEPIDLLEVLTRGLLAGTDPRSEGYWGDIGDIDQRLCEASDVSLSIWLVRRLLWDQLDDAQRGQILEWLSQANGKRITDNNWHLFPVLLSQVLSSLAGKSDDAYCAFHYQKMKDLYVGNGWFSDGPGRKFDYYNAFQMPYILFWIDRINPDWDRTFVHMLLRDLVENFKYLFSPEGLPIRGRSVCYRMAIPAPLVIGALLDPPAAPPGLARRALDCTWRHFIRKGAVANGVPTQGYYGPDMRFLDRYSGPASPLWCLRSLNVAWQHPFDSEFWTAPEEKLPVEEQDYELCIPSIGWTIRGTKRTGEVEILIPDAPPFRPEPVMSYTSAHALLGALSNRPVRPANRHAKYGLRRYSSRHPFCCERSPILHQILFHLRQRFASSD